MRPQTRENFTIAIFCALPVEAEAIECLFDESYDRLSKYYGKRQGDTNTYINGRVGDHHVVLCYMPGMGTTNAAAVASALRASYPRIQLALVVGICGGVPTVSKSENIFLGDVVISDSLVLYNLGRQYPGSFERKAEVQEALGRPNPEIRSLLNALRSTHSHNELESQIMQNVQELQKSDKKWCHPRINDILFDASYIHKHHQQDCNASCVCLVSETLDDICEDALAKSCDDLGCDKSQIIRSLKPVERVGVSAHIGTVACAKGVMKSGHHRDKIAKKDKIIGFEMEGAGVWDIFPCVVIKGVCDYADSHKNKLWQKYAAVTGASAAKAFLGYWRPQCHQAEKVGTYHFSVPFGRNHHFVGRQDELAQLEKWAINPQERGKLAVTGLGGIGKTQIALELAYRMHHNDSECSILWIPCKNNDSFRQACMAIAQTLGIQDVDPAKVEEQTNDRWLLILDGADDMDMWMNGSGTTAPLKNFLPSNRHGRIIFTTRNRKLAVKLASCDVIHARELDEQAGVELLRQSLIQQDLVEDKDAATYLVKQIALLPQAITQSAAYMNENEIGVYDYLMLLHEHEDNVVELLSEHFEADGRYDDSKNPTALTWFTSFRQIEKLDSLATEYLSLLACLSQQSISKSFLPRPVSRKKMVEALGLLSAYSFITIRPGDKCITMHRLVRLAARQWLRSQDRLEIYTHKAADRLSEVLNNDPVNEKHQRQYVQHTEFLLHELHAMAVQAQWNVRGLGGDGNKAEEEKLAVPRTNTLSHSLEP
ncbi:kinesin light chain [Aspergillus vadensis CBS 113365]|uniref:Kinesin light chain n=1 Tax=Aspergillus vadensis (strain CBS 113365 / IMI 142717 / IBT 24658) TaxID=1448311 RepID=A0A319B519_ASPVC|nr:kinesin light chain [Aspergillus vadensis CBS 113365]PYH67515.1 kinesin light chain [Aspergillus vadensis CBS 113365]